MIVFLTFMCSLFLPYTPVKLLELRTTSVIGGLSNVSTLTLFSTGIYHGTLVILEFGEFIFICIYF